MSFSVQRVRRRLISCDFNFDHLVKVVPARFLCCKVTGFLFALNKYLVERYFKSVNIQFLIILSPTITGDSCLNKLLWWQLPNGDFSNFRIPFTFISRDSTLFISVWTHEFLVYSMICNPLLSLFNLMLKLSQIWPVGAPSSWFLHPFDVSPPFSVCACLVSGKLDVHLHFPYPNLELAISPNSPSFL